MTAEKLKAVAEDEKLPPWQFIFDFNSSRQLKTVSPQEAQMQVNSGNYILVDVRTPKDYEEGHAEGAVNVPLVRNLDFFNTDAKGFLRGLAYVTNGVSPIEPNPDFMATLAGVAKEGKGMIVLCETGGTMMPSTNFGIGKSSRSLQAAFKIMASGVCDDVLHMDRGMYGWFLDQLPIEGEYDGKNAGKSPNIAPAAKVDERFQKN